MNEMKNFNRYIQKGREDKRKKVLSDWWKNIVIQYPLLKYETFGEVKMDKPFGGSQFRFRAFKNSNNGRFIRK